MRSTALQLLDERSWPAPVYYGSRTIRALIKAWPVAWRMALLAACMWTCWRVVKLRRLRARQKTVELSYTLFNHSVRFGLDIGGTLSKVVYFEPTRTTTPAQAALKARVSAFIRRSSSYGVTGRRDAQLEVTHDAIHGTLHFVCFQTAMMPNFVTIVKEHELSPQKPLPEGGGEEHTEAEGVGKEDALAEAPSLAGVSSLLARSNVHHHHAHHLHQPAQLSTHPAQLGRSYSAAWRSEGEFRQHLASLATEQSSEEAKGTPAWDPLTCRVPTPMQLALGAKSLQKTLIHLRHPLPQLPLLRQAWLQLLHWWIPPLLEGSLTLRWKMLPCCPLLLHHPYRMQCSTSWLDLARPPLALRQRHRRARVHRHHRGVLMQSAGVIDSYTPFKRLPMPLVRWVRPLRLP
jgi:hypothetical protein